MNVRKSDTVGSIVTNNILSASVFNNYGIDFYSLGNRTLQEACIDQRVPIVNVVEELWDIPVPPKRVPDFGNMNLIKLLTYILRTHHKFAERKLVFIRHTLERLVSDFGKKHSDLSDVKKTFGDMSVYLTVHMKHEEFIVFPIIFEMVRDHNSGFPLFQEIDQPLASIKEDHDHEVLALRKLADLTDNYTVPKGGDYSFRVAYNAMKELEEDLKIHIHLENNILLPKAIDYAYNRIESLN